MFILFRNIDSLNKIPKSQNILKKDWLYGAILKQNTMYTYLKDKRHSDGRCVQYTCSSLLH